MNTHIMTKFEDRFQIIDLINSFTIYFDERDLDEYIDCYADGGVFVIQFKGEITTWLEKDDMKRVFGPRLDEFAKNNQQRRHLTANVSIVEQSSSYALARANALLLNTTSKKDGTADLDMVSTVLYKYKVVKVENEWKFTEVFAVLDRQLDAEVKS